MTDAERYRMIRDLCVAVTGSWSANRVAVIAADLGLKAGRRSDLLAAIATACGPSNARAGRPRKLVPELVPKLVPKLVPELVPDRAPPPTGNQLSENAEPIFTRDGNQLAEPALFIISEQREKEKESKRKREIYSPGFLRNLAPSLAEFEADVNAFLAHLAAKNKSGQIDTGRAQTELRTIVDVRDQIKDDEAMVYGLRTAISRDAGTEYFAAVARKRASSRGAHVKPFVPATLAATADAYDKLLGLGEYGKLRAAK